MAETICSTCGGKLYMGDWPFCTGNPHDHMPAYRAGMFDFPTVVVHRKLGEDGQYVYSYPGHANDPVDAGYEKVELSTRAQADRFCRDRDKEENELRAMQINGERDTWDEKTKERRKVAAEQLQERFGRSHSRIGELVQRYVDNVRAQRYQRLLSKGTNFHIKSMETDSRNMAPYVDDSKKRISVVVNRSGR